jgi:hypothetical protein
VCVRTFGNCNIKLKSWLIFSSRLTSVMPPPDNVYHLPSGVVTRAVPLLTKACDGGVTNGCKGAAAIRAENPDLFPTAPSTK